MILTPELKLLIAAVVLCVVVVGVSVLLAPMLAPENEPRRRRIIH